MCVHSSTHRQRIQAGDVLADGQVEQSGIGCAPYRAKLGLSTNNEQWYRSAQYRRPVYGDRSSNNECHLQVMVLFFAHDRTYDGLGPSSRHSLDLVHYYYQPGSADSSLELSPLDVLGQAFPSSTYLHMRYYILGGDPATSKQYILM